MLCVYADQWSNVILVVFFRILRYITPFSCNLYNYIYLKFDVSEILVISGTGYVDKCDFEGLGGICDYRQDTGDKTDWQPQSGPTGSQGTGPDNDHTKGTGIITIDNTPM